MRLCGIQILPKIFHIGPKYSTPAKFEGLKNLLGEAGSRVMEDLPGYVSGRTAKPDFLITSFGYDRERVVYFRSDLKSRTSSFPPKGSPQKHYTLAEAIHASSTPPVNYFKEPAEFNGNRYWDGGVSGNNNPVLSAVTKRDNPNSTSKLTDFRSAMDSKPSLRGLSNCSVTVSIARSITFIYRFSEIAPWQRFSIRKRPTTSPRCC